MATTKLTNHIRESILKDLLAYAFLERAQAQIDAECDFSTAVFEDVYSKHLDMIKSAPDGFFCRFDYNVPADWRSFGVKHRENANRRMPSGARSNQAIKWYDLDHAMTVKFLKLKADREALKLEIERTSRTAKATLASVSTISKLIDVWPEARVFAEKYAVQGEAKAILPAIPRRELNNALGLPPASELRVAGGEVVA